MTWRQIRWAIVAVLVAVLGCAEQSEPAKPAATLSPSPVRNLLLICIDTVRTDVFYALGETEGDALAEWRDRALDFTRVTSTSSWTVPSIGSVLTGLWPYSHGAGRFPDLVADLFTQPPVRAYKDVPFLTQVARKSGFHTAAISASAWTHDRYLSMGLLRGFEEVAEYEADWRSMVADASSAFAASEQSGRKFYLLHLMEAHDWHMESEERLNARLAELTPHEREVVSRLASDGACRDRDSTLCKRYRVYIAATREIRKAVATMLDNLRQQGTLDDTVVILFSDHGEDFSEHADAVREPVRPQGFADSHLQHYGHGHLMYEELLHVPLMVWHPAYEGAVINQPVSLVDIGPSAARWLGLDFMPDSWPGYFLDETLKPSSELADRVLYASNIAYGEEQVSVRVGDKKSIWYAVSDAIDYFDLASDPSEKQPQGAPSWSLYFDGLLLDYIEKKPRQAAEAGDLTAEQIRQLQSIGYLQGVDVDEGDDTGRTEPTAPK